MEGSGTLRILIGAPRSCGGLQPPTIVVDAQADRLEALREQLGSDLTEVDLFLKQAVLAATPDAEVIWFRFNDSRLNGVVPLQRWQSIYPNLQLTGQDTLIAQTLADLLNDWLANREELYDLDLTICQGDPLEILKGAGRWIHRLQQIHLRGTGGTGGTGGTELWREHCEPWLQQQGFRPDPQDPASWNLDPIGAKLIQQRAEVDNIRVQHEQEIRNLTERNNKLLAALRHVFPYASYRQFHPDIAALNDQELLNYFIRQGAQEDIHLQFSTIGKGYRQLPTNPSVDTSRTEMLNDKTRETAQQLDLLKDLLARLVLNP